MARTPVQAAPITAAMLASSSSMEMKTPPAFGSLRAIVSAISVDGVIG